MGYSSNHPRPDLEDPILPDAVEDLTPEFEWPEAGPSKAGGAQRSALSDQTLGPKAIAAMTGALTTSLLSKYLPTSAGGKSDSQ